PDDSMEGAGIERNDVIIFRSGAHAETASIVASISRGEGFVRNYLPSSDGRLVELAEAGENPRSATFPIEEVKILGILVGLIRSKI
ncbi:MAG TPA: S24 family peptidase, partial [Victivallales bacterium]|nr:S24 family peptidase [Victivallales bacterium]